jgi:hypothetical protein
MITMHGTPAVKIIENHQDRRVVRQQQMQQVRFPQLFVPPAP